jgi:hypothetical protein
MTRKNAATAGLGLVALLWAIPAAAQTRCTQETLPVRGTPVTIGYCVTGTPAVNADGETTVVVAASYSVAGRSVPRSESLHFVSGERVSRVLDSFALAALGLDGVLHLTLSYSGGLVAIEGALLTPGAITIK